MTILALIENLKWKNEMKNKSNIASWSVYEHIKYSELSGNVSQSYKKGIAIAD